MLQTAHSTAYGLDVEATKYDKSYGLLRLSVPLGIIPSLSTLQDTLWVLRVVCIQHTRVQCRNESCSYTVGHRFAIMFENCTPVCLHVWESKSTALTRPTMKNSFSICLRCSCLECLTIGKAVFWHVWSFKQIFVFNCWDFIFVLLHVWLLKRMSPIVGHF